MDLLVFFLFLLTMIKWECLLTGCHFFALPLNERVSVSFIVSISTCQFRLNINRTMSECKPTASGKTLRQVIHRVVESRLKVQPEQQHRYLQTSDLVLVIMKLRGDQLEPRTMKYSPSTSDSWAQPGVCPLAGKETIHPSWWLPLK